MIASRRTLIALGIWMLGGMLLSLGALLLIHATSAAWMFPTALALFAVSVAGPILAFGWLLGRVFARHGGWVGLVFAGGVLAGAAGQAGGIDGLMWGGWIAVGVGATGLMLLAVRRFRALAPRPPRAAPSRRPTRDERRSTAAAHSRER